MQRCARCGEEFAPVRFIQDLKKTLQDVGENYSLQGPAAPVLAGEHVQPRAGVVEETARTVDGSPAGTGSLWWQDLCPTCKRVMRAQANLAALGRGGNQFL